METGNHQSGVRHPIDASTYEDSLILFVVRLLQLQVKRHYQRYKPPETKFDLNEDETAITNAGIVEVDVDEEHFVSYLSVVRQFWAKNDALGVHRIKRILLYTSRLLGDTELRQRVKEVDLSFRTRWNKCYYNYCRAEGEPVMCFSQHELANFWFNTIYFHTDLTKLDRAVPLFTTDTFRKWSRSQFEVYLYHFVRYAQTLGREATGILWKGVLPPGKLHGLLEMYVPLEIITAEERQL